MIMKKVSLLLVIVLATCTVTLVACGNKNKNTLGTGELTYANYQLLETGKTTPEQARQALGPATTSAIALGSGSMTWIQDEITVVLTFVNGKLVTRTATGFSDMPDIGIGF